MTINISNLYGRDVLDVATAKTVGKIRCAIIDAPSGKVNALVLDKTLNDAEILSWSDIKSIGPDAITVESVDVFRAAGKGEERAAKGDLDPVGKRVLTDAGEEVGELSDIVVDEESGTVEHAIVGDGQVGGQGILGSGNYAVVVERTALSS